MARFCTQCGTPADAESRFCVECGTPCKANPPEPTPASAPASEAGVGTALAPRPGKRALLIGGVAAVVLVGVGGAAYLLADQKATPEVFANAISSYYAANTEAADKLLCVGGLQLDRNPVRLNSMEGERRRFMDELATAGLFAPAVVQSSGGFFSIETYSYSRTDAGSQAIRDGRLCAAPALKVTDVRFAAEASGPQVVARFRYDFERPAAWLAGNLAQQVRQRLSQQDERVAVMALQDGKWIMISDNPRTARAMAAGSRAEAPPPSMLERVKGWFRTGNPLLGKWRVTNALWLDGTVITFSETHAAVGRPDEAVTYEIKDQRITVRYTERGASDVFVVKDDDHLTLEGELASVQLVRIKE